jgi:hypothetical protein
MRDLPHHMKKLNRRVIRSSLREPAEETPGLPPFHKSEEEARKMEKRRMRDRNAGRTQIHDTPDEMNWKMKQRVPVFDRNNAVPKRARPTKKKTPRI